MTVLSFRMIIITFMLLFAYYLFDLKYLSNDFPDTAISYLQWWQAQPLNSLQEILLQYGLLIELVLLLSLVGMAFLWAWARFIFTGAMLLSIVSEVFFSVPLIVIGRHIMLGNLISVMSGILIYAMFFTPLRDQFSVNPFKSKGSVSIDH